jgi:hypothetical protein
MILGTLRGAVPSRWLSCLSGLEGITASLKSLIAGRSGPMSPVTVVQSALPPVSPADHRRCVCRRTLAGCSHARRQHMQRFGHIESLSLRALPKESHR